MAFALNEDIGYLLLPTLTSTVNVTSKVYSVILCRLEYIAAMRWSWSGQINLLFVFCFNAFFARWG